MHPIDDTHLAYVKLIASGMYRRFRGQFEYEEFVCIGNLALVESASAYKGGAASLKTFCDKHVRGTMLRYATKEIDKRRPVLYGDWVFSIDGQDEISFEESIADYTRKSPLDTVITNQMAERALQAIAAGPARKCESDSRSTAEVDQQTVKITKAIKLFVMQEMPRAQVAELLRVNEVRVWKYCQQGFERARRALIVKSSIRA